MSGQILSTALRLHELGLAVHWLRPRSKAPIKSCWSKARILSPDELRTSYQPGYNIGVRCGHWSQPRAGCGLVAIDIDIRDTDDRCDPFEVLYRFFDIDVFAVQSGSGLGQHWWFACPFELLPSKANTLLAKSGWVVDYLGHQVPSWSIEILSTGKNLVCPPSIHPDTGRPYKWLSEIDSEIPLLPESILDAIREEPPSKTSTSRHDHQGTPAGWDGKESVADMFRHVSWPAILEPHGWQLVSDHGERQYWCRPGKKRTVSASTLGDVFYPFTTSTQFEANRGYSKFQAYAILEHSGNMSAAAKHLLALTESRRVDKREKIPVLVQLSTVQPQPKVRRDV